MAEPRIWVLVALAGACRPSQTSTAPDVAPTDRTSPTTAFDEGVASRPDVDAPQPTETRASATPDRPRAEIPAHDGRTETPDRRAEIPAHDRRGKADPADRPVPEPGVAGPFVRGAWARWIDVDGDCQDTRAEVLIASSEVPVTFADDRRCTVTAGQWRCPYTDHTITDPQRLDIDHLVPLAHVHEAGGATWDEARWRAYANATGDPDHLVAVDRSANRSKGARTVVQWLPEEQGFRCQYVGAWRRIKQSWRLVESDDERVAIDDALQRCEAGDVPPRPGKTTTTPRVPGDTPPASACCRVCKSGKPCGDACIASDKTCRKPPGCAC